MSPSGRVLRFCHFGVLLVALAAASVATAQNTPRISVELEQLPPPTGFVEINGTSYTDAFDVSFLLEDMICPMDAVFVVTLEAAVTANNSTTFGFTLTPQAMSFPVPAAPYLVDSFADTDQATLVVQGNGQEAPGGNVTVNVAATLAGDAHGCSATGTPTFVSDLENPFALRFVVQNVSAPEPTPSPKMPGPAVPLLVLTAFAAVAVTSRRRP